MLKPSPETQKIRQIVEQMSDADLRTMGPSDLREAVEETGLTYEDVHNKVNNELARARRKRGIRKGRGRKIAAQFPTDPEFLRLARVFSEVDRFKEQFATWDDALRVAEEVWRLSEALGGKENLREVIEMKRDDEKADRKAGRL